MERGQWRREKGKGRGKKGLFWLHACRRGAALDEAFDPPLKVGTGQEHFAPARQAAHPNFGPEPDDTPGIAAAGVGFAHLHGVIERDWNGRWHTLPLLGWS